MAFGGEVHDGGGLVGFEDGFEGGGVAEVGLDEVVLGVAVEVAEGFEVAGVGEFVEVDDVEVFFEDEEADEVGADEAGAAGDEDGGGCG